MIHKLDGKHATDIYNNNKTNWLKQLLNFYNMAIKRVTYNV